ncbi:hypothetical protein HOLleu_43733 [Holothuria leucospilota]|uniref:Uncharacterized protein n=1 Tax=Holothuria leucospilota TaxID=206669 RepID=A0A9Q1B9L7_HOLLE|nr:hypothetical protein HOLleu_43733 [Holothuria leucospilota]
MYPSCQPQILWGNQQYSTAAQGPSSRSDGNLWGSNVRRIMGILQIVCGVIGFTFGVAVICVPLRDFDYVDYAGWGLWNGMFATVTGFLGVYRKKEKGMVIFYMVTSIIASVMAAACCVYAGFGASESNVSSLWCLLLMFNVRVIWVKSSSKTFFHSFVPYLEGT